MLALYSFKLGVKDEFLRPLLLDTPVTLDGGVQAWPQHISLGMPHPAQTKRLTAPPLLSRVSLQVTLIDANHCPGAVLLLFEHLPGGARVLHTGDARLCDAHERHAALLVARAAGVDALFLDTTYCNPKCVALRAVAVVLNAAYYSNHIE